MGNHDIIVVERVSIPNFSKPGNIGTLLKLYESFFDDAVVDIYFGYTKLYSHREKADTSFEITNEAFCLSVSFKTVKRTVRHPPPP